MTPLRLVAVAGGVAGAAAFSVITWLASRVTCEFDRVVDQALRAVRQPPPPETATEHAEWVMKLRRQAELDAIEGSIRRHPAGKRRPR